MASIIMSQHLLIRFMPKYYAKVISLYLQQNFAYQYTVQRKDGEVACGHLKGGLKSVLNSVCAKISEFKFFYKTDVFSYYASIGHKKLLEILYDITGDHILIFQLSRYLDRLKRVDGLLETSRKMGICRGCSLSPIFSGIYLSPDSRLTHYLGYFLRWAHAGLNKKTRCTIGYNAF